PDRHRHAAWAQASRLAIPRLPAPTRQGRRRGGAEPVTPLRPLRRALLGLALAIAMGGCATIDPWHDARIEAEVKARLVAEPSANLTKLGVVSNHAVVHLSGTVGSTEQSARAEALAKSVDGVKRVVNTLDVGPTSR